MYAKNLKNTANYAISYEKPENIFNSSNLYRFYLIRFLEVPINWISRIQQSFALLTMQAEFIALLAVV